MWAGLDFMLNIVHTKNVTIFTVTQHMYLFCSFQFYQKEEIFFKINSCWVIKENTGLLVAKQNEVKSNNKKLFKFWEFEQCPKFGAISCNAKWQNVFLQRHIQSVLLRLWDLQHRCLSKMYLYMEDLLELYNFSASVR